MKYTLVKLTCEFEGVVPHNLPKPTKYVSLRARDQGEFHLLPLAVAQD